MRSLVWSLYGAAGTLATPLAGPHLARRVKRGKEEAARVAEKRGIASAPAFDAPPLWIHGVSIGESVAGLTLAQRLGAYGWPVLLTTSTPAAAARLAPAVSERLRQQYAPLDVPPFVGRFLDHWRPAAAIFVESEIWPTTLLSLKRRGVPLAHVNARLSARSFRRWRRAGAPARVLFGAIDLALAQTAEQAERFAALGTPETRSTGNIKFDAAPPAADPAAVTALREAIGARPVWLAASTHPGEEEAVFAAHAELARRWPDLLTILAPRHAERGEALAAMAAPLGRVTRRSAGEGPDGAVYLADTFGEMGTLFAAIPLVLLGGSLRPYGGHNPAEPAAFGAALLTGASHGDMFTPFLEAGAARVVDDATLAHTLAELIGTPEARADLAARAGAVLAAERGAIDRTLTALAGWLPERGA